MRHSFGAWLHRVTLCSQCSLSSCVSILALDLAVQKDGGSAANEGRTSPDMIPLCTLAALPALFPIAPSLKRLKKGTSATDAIAVPSSPEITAESTAAAASDARLREYCHLFFVLFSLSTITLRAR